MATSREYTHIHTITAMYRQTKHQQSPTMDSFKTSEFAVDHANAANPLKEVVCDTTPPPTPTAMSSSVHQFIDEIQRTRDALSELTSLAPSPQVNTLLSRLVDLCVEHYSSSFLAYVWAVDGVPNICSDLRRLCSTAEGELESYWAARILNSASSSNVSATELLSMFPYQQNYVDLSRLESMALEVFLPPLDLEPYPSTSSNFRTEPRHMCFIGSGPLPLTSFCMLDRYSGVKIHNIDRDQNALKLSAQLAQKLGYSDRMTFAYEDVSAEHDQYNQSERIDSNNKKEAFTMTKWSDFDVVFLAALVGMDTESKISILTSLARKLNPGTLVVVRSAHGLRSVLYPIFDLGEELLNLNYDVLVEVHPWTKVVNSVVVLRVK